MASSYTTSLALEKQETGSNDNSWGTQLNATLDLVDMAVAGYLAVDCAGSSDVTLTAAQQRRAVLKFTGALTGNINVIVSAVSKLWLIHNGTSGSYTLTVKTSAGTGIEIPQGQKTVLYCDGTNVLGGVDAFLANAFAIADNTDTTKKIDFDVSGVTAGQTRTITPMDADMTLLGPKGGDIASASPLVIDTDGSYFDVTGTTGFSAMTVAAGRFFVLQFDGALTITHGSGITIPGAANYTTIAGDQMLCFSTAANTVFVLAITNSGALNMRDRVLQRPEIKDYAETEASVSSSSGTLTLDCESGNNFHTTLTENVTTLTLSNWSATGKRASITLEITQHASSAKTVDFGSVDFGDIGAPDLTTVGSVTIVVLTTRDAGTTVYGMTAFQKTS